MQGLREGATVAAGNYELATIGSRFVAKILDSLILAALGFVVGITMASVASGSFVQIGANLAGNALSLIYSISFLGWRGQTPGKMAMKIKVVSPDGSPIGWGKAVGRPFAEILSGCLLAIGYLIAFWDNEKRTLHDRLAGTRVIKVNT